MAPTCALEIVVLTDSFARKERNGSETFGPGNLASTVVLLANQYLYLLFRRIALPGSKGHFDRQGPHG